AELSAEGQAVLAHAADTIRQNFPNQSLVIEGHTDNTPITHSSWKSNWDLGAARALSVLHYLEIDQAFPSERLAAISHGDTRPAASNDTEAGRASNRRAVIVILPEKANPVQAINSAKVAAP